MEPTNILVVIGMVALLFSAVSNFIASRRPTIRRPLYQIGAVASLAMLVILILVYSGLIDASADRLWIIVATISLTAWGAFSMVDWGG